MRTLLFVGIINLASSISAQTFQVLWEKSYGGSELDYCFHSTLLADGCIIAVGTTSSNDGDIHGFHDPIAPFEQAIDIWVIKLNLDGDTIWTKALGGTDSDKGFYVQATPDSGCIIAGGTLSSYGQISINYGYYDFWIVKLDKNGNINWEKTFGGTDSEIAKSIKRTSDNGYIICGWTYSNDMFVHGNHDSQDIWIVKLNELKDTLWTRCFGGSDIDIGWDIVELSDHNYLAIGQIYSTNGDITDNYDDIQNTWVVKLDTLGNVLWKKCYHNNGYNIYSQQSIISTIDGFVFLDNKEVYEYSTEIYKCNNDGDTIWTKSIPARNFLSGDEYGQTTRGIFSDDSNIVVVVPQFDAANNIYSFLIEKINNINGDSIWAFNVNFDDTMCIPSSIVQTSKNTFVASGYKLGNNFEDFYFLKFSVTTQGIATKNLNKIHFSLFPNPSTSGRFTVQLPQHSSPLYINISDNNGNILFIDKIDRHQTEYFLNKKLSKGTYLLTLSNQNTLSSKKIIVQ